MPALRPEVWIQSGPSVAQGDEAHGGEAFRVRGVRQVLRDAGHADAAHAHLSQGQGGQQETRQGNEGCELQLIPDENDSES